MKETKMSTRTLVTASLMTALVVVCQLLATYTAFFGPFSTAAALVPISIGAILCGPGVGAFLGLIFALIVFVTNGAALFLAVDIPGTIITVVLKGVLCGYVSGLLFKIIRNKNYTLASIVSAISCPIVNTGIFMLGCYIFFMDDVVAIAKLLRVSQTGYSLFIAMALGNFLFELGMSIVLSPIVVRLINIRNKQ